MAAVRRKRAQRDEWIQAIIEGLGEACLIVNKAGVVLFSNPQLRNLFPSSLVPQGRKLFEVLTDHRLVAAAERAQNQNAMVQEAVTASLNTDGKESVRYLVINAAPLALTGVKDSPWLRITIRDETEQRDTEQIRKDFVANASHELRTPLSIINGYLENLVEGLIDEPAMVKRSLETMQKHSLRLARIVEDMLTISRFESVGEHEAASLRKSSFEVSHCVADVIERLHPVIEKHKAVVKQEYPPEGSRINGDRFYWEQVFFNLIENALKENRRPGLVISVGLQRRGDKTEIWVADNGVGIPRADVPFVFKRFYRVAKHHSSEIKGTGLGLSIVRRAVEAHGGTISVESTPGQLTKFTMTLPHEPSEQV